jgi:anti-anti-sigma factor
MMSGEVCVLRPEGRLDGATAPVFEGDLSKAIAGGANKLLLDMAGLNYISSAGLRIVLQAAKQMKSKGGRLALCSLKEQIKEVFDISGFSGLLDIAPTLEVAMMRLSA